MEERIVKFINALRAAGVRISLAESVDAFQAVDKLGIQDKAAFRTSLRATLIKDAESIPAFEELFPLFFGGSPFAPSSNLDEDLSPDEARQIAEALRHFKDQIRQMIERLLSGEKLKPDELERLAKMVGLSQIDDLRYRQWMTQRMQRALRFREVREALEELAQMLQQMGMNRQRVNQLQQLLQANMQAIEEQLSQYAGQRIVQNMRHEPPAERIDQLMNRPFNTLTDHELDLLRKEVRRLAAVLRTRAALRQRRAKSGQLDAKATLRANLKHGSVPVEIKFRHRALKPKLVVICDVSTSMRSCSEFMLSLLYELQDQINKTSAFAFIDHLESISADLENRDGRQAVRQVLERMPSGHYNTDLGYSLQNFWDNYLSSIDSRTTFLVVGDGRNNYNDPRLDLFTPLARRSRRTIWLTPEGPSLWGTGDSDMLRYAPVCDIVLHANNLAELARAVDKLLVTG
jgi:uncharacterized protein with von Willebrand factor type A (vWA) domain